LDASVMDQITATLFLVAQWYFFEMLINTRTDERTDGPRKKTTQNKKLKKKTLPTAATVWAYLMAHSSVPAL